LAVGIGSLQYVLDQGQQKDWFGDDSIVICTALAVSGLIAFVTWELFQKKPIVDLSVLKNRSVAAGSILGMVLGISLYGSVLILPQYVQGSLGFTATLSGQLLIFRAGTVMLFTPLTAALVARNKLDPRIVVMIGFVLIGVSNYMLAQVTTPQADFWTFFWPLAISGMGLAQIFVPLTVGVLGSVEPPKIPAAAAMFNLARQIGGSVAIAVLVTMLARENAIHQTELASQVTLRSSAVGNYVRARGDLLAARRDLDGMVRRQAVILSYADTARAVAAISLLLAPLAFLLKRPVRPAIVAAE
jgi:DHA2 family multidrug resistance protein